MWNKSMCLTIWGCERSHEKTQLFFTILVFFFKKKKMDNKLPAECLNNIFEHLEDFTIVFTDHRLWRGVAIRVLWRNIWDFQYTSFHNLPFTFLPIHDEQLPSMILKTLISCLPNESKDLLRKNGIFIPASASKPPLFNHISFIKVLPINTINRMIADSSVDDRRLVLHELLKVFMNQIPSLKTLKHSKEFQDIPWSIFPKRMIV